MKSIKINRNSNFKLLISLDNEELKDVPFSFVFTSGRYKQTKYIASFDGETYVNCQKTNVGDILVIFDNHNLPVGQLMVVEKFKFSDDDMPDGYNDVFNEMPVISVDSQGNKYEVFLTYEKTEIVQQLETSILINTFRGYKGDKGDKGNTGTGISSITKQQEDNTKYVLKIDNTDGTTTLIPVQKAKDNFEEIEDLTKLID